VLLCEVAALDVPKLVINPFVTRHVSVGHDGHIFLLCHNSCPRPNWANPFVTLQESKAKLAIYPTP